MSFFIQPNGGSNPNIPDFIEVVGGNPNFTISNVTQTEYVDPQGNITIVGNNVAMPYTVDGIYAFRPLSSGILDNDFNWNWTVDTVLRLYSESCEIRGFWNNRDDTTIESIICPNLQSTGYWRLDGCTNLEELKLESLTDITNNTSGFALWLNNCTSLTNSSLDISALTTLNAGIQFQNTLFTTFNLPNLISMNNSGLNVSGMVNLETIELPSYTTGILFNASSLPELRIINLPLLVNNASATNAGQLRFNNCPKLERVLCPSLEKMQYCLGGSCPLLTEIDFRSLNTITANNGGNSLNLNSNPLLDTLRLDSLVIVNSGMFFNQCDALASLSLPVLNDMGVFSVDNCDVLTSVFIPIVIDFSSSVSVENNPLLISIDIGDDSGFSAVSSGLDYGGNALPEAEVDRILAHLLAMGAGYTGTRTIILSGGTNAAPSLAGETSIDALRLAGWTVTVTGGY